MPKERRRSLREAVACRASPLGDGVGKERLFSSEQPPMEEQSGAPEQSGPGRGALVPQVTITAAADVPMEQTELDTDLDEVNGPLCRKLSNSSISSNGSSAGLEESEDDILSDNETKSKGIITLEHLGDAGEVGSFTYSGLHSS